MFTPVIGLDPTPCMFLEDPMHQLCAGMGVATQLSRHD